jgi:hypothetical protein
MEVKIKVVDKKNIEEVKRLCEQFGKECRDEDVDDNIIIIKGDDLEGLLDKITMGPQPLGEIIK